MPERPLAPPVASIREVYSGPPTAAAPPRPPTRKAAPAVAKRFEALANQMRANAAVNAGNVKASTGGTKQNVEQKNMARAAQVAQREGKIDAPPPQTAVEMDRMILKDQLLNHPARQDTSAQDRMRRGPQVGDQHATSRQER